MQSDSTNQPNTHSERDVSGPQRKYRLCKSPQCPSDRMLDAIQSGLVFFGTDGTVCHTNSQAREDLRIADPIGHVKIADLFSLIHHNKNILPDLIDELNRRPSEQVKLPVDTFIRRTNAKVQFFVSGCISRLDCGNYLLSFRNIVEELTLQSVYKMALSSTKIFPWYYEFERGSMFIDPRYFDYTGIESEDYTLSLEAFAERLHPDDREGMAHAFSLQLNGEHYPYPVPFRLRRGDGSYEWFEGQSTYLGQVEGLPYRVVGICMSTQAHKDIEDALTYARDKAEQSDRLKSAFLANMSHEIRTPLNAIVGFAHLLAGEESPTTTESREHVELINKNCDHLLTLVSDILDLSRIETGAMEYTFAEHSLHQLLSDLYHNHRSRMPENVALNLLLPHDDLLIETDALRVRQVMGNLLDNAAKFTCCGHIDMGFMPSSDGQSVRLFVADTGRGIPAEETERIFERFYKIDNFMQGAGLGLSLCKTIAGHLGGTVTVSSRQGAGSRFTLRLPVRRSSVPSMPNH